MSGRGRPTRRVPLAGILLVVGLLGLAACAGGDGASRYAAEDLATGEPVEVASLRGQPVLLVSWATWCRECDEELAALQAFASSEAADGVAVVAVNLDAGSVDDEIEAKIDRHGLTTRLWRDRRNGFKREFSALGVPTTVLLDADGRVVETFPGAAGFAEEVQAAVERVRGGT